MDLKEKIRLIKNNFFEFFYLLKAHFFWKSIYKNQNNKSDLITKGYQIIPNFLSELKAENLLNSIKLFEQKNKPKNDKNFSNVARKDLDQTVIQYHDIDKKFKNGINKLGKKIEKLISDNLNSDFKVSLINISFQRDNIDPFSTKRGFHLDDFGGSHKAFLYLTDVLNKGFGPYTYIESSHRRFLFMKLFNQFLNIIFIRNSGSMYNVWCSKNMTKLMLYPKGSLIMSNQLGLHRGYSPQTKGIREMIMFYYSVKKIKK